MDVDSETRRKMRVRRILENSERRLKKITSVTDERELEVGMDCFEIKHFNQHTQPTAVVDEETEINNIKPAVSILSTSNIQPLKSLGSVFNDPQLESHQSVSEIELIQSGYLTRNYFIIFLSLVVRCLYSLNEFFYHSAYIGLNRIFVPLLMFEIIEYVFFKPFIPQSGALNILFMLNNRIKPEYLVMGLGAFRFVTRVVQDLMMYFFFFVFFDKLLAIFY